MKLQEHHKEYVVRNSAYFMKLTDIVEAFMEEFADELPQPELPEPPDIAKLMAEPLSNSETAEKLVVISDYYNSHAESFEEEYDENAEEKLKESALENYNEYRENSYRSAYWREREATIQAHEKSLKQELFNQFRRFDIRHPQFPKKYRKLFEQYRKEFFASYRLESLKHPENLITKLETLYGYVENLIFQEDNPRQAAEYVRLDHQLLQSIATHTAVIQSQQQAAKDIAPQNVKAIQETSNAQETLTESHPKRVRNRKFHRPFHRPIYRPTKIAKGSECEFQLVPYTEQNPL